MTKKHARQQDHEAHKSVASASPAAVIVKPIPAVPGSPKKGRQRDNGAQDSSATLTPATNGMKPSVPLPGSLIPTIEAIRAAHRERRFAMGIQQVLDRKLESFIRINKTDWHVGDDETTRDKANKEVAAKIKAARDGEGDESVIMVVGLTDKARAPADAERIRHEKKMESLAHELPVAPWVETVPGLGYLGLATIVAETGDLAMYSNVAKVWKRLGYAPHDGLAGSSWKRPTWRNGRAALTAEEWTEHPFSGRRYAMIHTISVWLKNKQWIGAAKTDDGVGKPNGIYGEVYAKRRAHTAETHPEWSKQHGHMDALRVMMKSVLKHLYFEWNPEKKLVGRHPDIEAQRIYATDPSPANIGMKPKDDLPGSPIEENGRQNLREAQPRFATASPATAGLKSETTMPGSPHSENGRQCGDEAQLHRATASPATLALKPKSTMPGSPVSVANEDSKSRRSMRPKKSPAKPTVKPSRSLPGSSFRTRTPRHV